MSNDDQRWHPENDDWQNRSAESPTQGQDEPVRPTFGYFDRPHPENFSQPSSEYGQFGRSSDNFRQAPYGGYESSPFPLHPLSPMEQIDAAVRLIRYNPAVLVVLPLIVYLVVGVISTVIALLAGESLLSSTTVFSTDQTVELSNTLIVSTVLVSLVSFIAGLFIYTTAVNAAMSAIYGRKISIGRAISMSAGDSGRLALAYITYALIFLVIAAAIGFLIQPFVDVLGEGGLFVFFLALLAGFFYLAIRISCAVPALVAEQRGPFSSIKRSFELTKGRVGSIFVTLIATFFLSFMMIIVFSIIIAVFSFLTFGTTTGIIIYSTITNALMSAILVAFTQAVTNVIYINMRMIRENFHYDVRNP